MIGPAYRHRPARRTRQKPGRVPAPPSRQFRSKGRTAGIADRFWTLEDIVTKIAESAPAPKPRYPNKKRGTP